MQGKRAFSFLVACLLISTVAAQSNDLLQNKDVTPESLINALSPKPGSAAAANEPAAQAEGAATGEGATSGPRMRQFKMVRDKPAAGAAPSTQAAAPRPAVARPSASLMITFESGSARLTQASRKILDTVAQALNSEKLSKFRFNIEGHADPTGLAEQNLRLSEERAGAVRQYLSTSHSVDAARMIAVGKGSSELLNQANPTAPENRRVRIVNVSQ